MEQQQSARKRLGHFSERPPFFQRGLPPGCVSPEGLVVSPCLPARDSMDKAVRWTLILACMALVWWVRVLPLSLPAVDDQADQVVQLQIRGQLTREAVRHSSPVPGKKQLDQEVEEWIAHNPTQVAERKAAVSQTLKSRLRYTGPDGQEYVYLGGVDSYLWLRHARNYLRSGTTCDAIDDGECRDTYGTAPVGERMIYGRSLHIAAIVGLHTLISYFKPDYPLPASAFFVPVIVGALGVLPAFFIGWGLAGNAGGLCAAVVVSLQPVFLSRSISSDNDVWNVVLPLFMMWAALSALAAPEWRGKIGYALLAAGGAGLQAGVWRGWFFTYSIVLLCLLAHVFLLSIQYVVRKQTVRVWQSREVRESALVGVTFYLAAGLCTTLAGAEQAHFFILPKILEPVLQQLIGQQGIVNAGDKNFWPDALTTVGELVQPDLWTIIESVGGPLFFCGGLLGLLLIVLPNRHWRWYHWAVLLGGVASYGDLLTRNTPGRVVTLGMIVLPLVCGLSLCLFDDEKSDPDLGPALLVIVWFLAALYVAYNGVRFLLQMGTAFGVAFAVAVGRLYAWPSRLIQERVQTWYRWPAHAVLCLLIAAVLIRPVQQGYETAREYVPRMSDGWWNTLTKIRDESAPDAIVNTWWDYGHWAKYAAERRVSADGGTLLTHVPHWLGRVLATPDEKESIGLLRMLNCGSDASPAPEKRQGAYGKVLAKVGDGIVAHTIVLDLVTRDAAQAREYLAERGFSPAEQDDVLRSTHCVPPESYLIISGEQVLKTGAWMHLGLWDFRKAYIVKRSRTLPQAEAVADLVQRFGYAEEEATRLYTSAKALDAPVQMYNFIAPKQGYFSPQWIACHAKDDKASFVCPVGIQASSTGSILETVMYRPAAPTESRVHFRHPQGARSLNHPTEGTPAFIILAGAQDKEEVFFPAPTYPHLGVLVDVPKQRILLGPPHLIRSMFTQLLYLDGRYSHYYEKFDEEMTYMGEPVITWKVKWGEQKELQKGSAGLPSGDQSSEVGGISDLPWHLTPSAPASGEGSE